MALALIVNNYFQKSFAVFKILLKNAEKNFKNNPGKKKMARISQRKKEAMLADLKAGKGCDEIAVTHGVGRQSVFTLREKHRDELPNWKRRTARTLMDATSKLVARINTGIDSKDASLKDECISVGILIDKAGQLRAEPSQIVEHRLEIGAELGGWLENREQISAIETEKDANVIDIGESKSN